jgi:hypothetical protein
MDNASSFATKADVVFAVVVSCNLALHTFKRSFGNRDRLIQFKASHRFFLSVFCFAFSIFKFITDLFAYLKRHIKSITLFICGYSQYCWKYLPVTSNNTQLGLSGIRWEYRLLRPIACVGAEREGQDQQRNIGLPQFAAQGATWAAMSLFWPVLRWRMTAGR